MYLYERATTTTTKNGSVSTSDKMTERQKCNNNIGGKIVVALQLSAQKMRQLIPIRSTKIAHLMEKLQ